MPFQKCLVRSLFQNTPSTKYYNPITELTVAHAVGNVDCRLIPNKRVKIFINRRLRKRVKRRGGLIKDNKRRILVQCPCDGKLLRLPAGNRTP